MTIPLSVQLIFELLFEHYGPRGWWPILTRADTPGFDSKGYHPGVYDIPRNRADSWEIMAGSILTQNTAWTNVEKALLRLYEARALSPEGYLSFGPESQIDLIRPAGYFNQKSVRIERLARYFLDHPQGPESREELLCQKGVGPETADSILLYAFGRPSFVVDLYTIRLICRTGLLSAEKLPKTFSKRYEYVQYFVTSDIDSLPGLNLIQTYQEDHALVVHNAKIHCAAKPKCGGCPLERYCPKLPAPV